MTTALKDCVVPGSPQTAMTLMLMVTQQVCAEYDAPHIITSLADGVHSKKSLHAWDRALDLRIRDPQSGSAFFDDVHAAADAIQSRLGSCFDVIVEPTHLHLEFDPALTSGVIK